MATPKRRAFALFALASLFVALAATSASAEVYNLQDPRFRGLVAFSDGPDPTGKSPVYFMRMDSKTLHWVTSGPVAAAKFGNDWADGILFCGRANADQNLCRELRSYSVGIPIEMNTSLYGTFGVSRN
jgi:hypothetical protein